MPFFAQSQACGARRSSSPGFMLRMKKCGGFSLLELGIVAIVLSLILLVFANRLMYYREMAEKSDAEYTIRALKSVLRMKMATMLFDGRAHEFVKLAHANPMDWLDDKPANYAGRFDDRSAIVVPPGSWYFNTDRHTLVYRVRFGAHFVSSDSGGKEIRLSVEPVSHESDKASPDDARAGSTVAVKLMKSYKWL